jgi:hypothetical protein
MCADLLTVAHIRKLLKGIRDVCMHDVHVIQTPYMNRARPNDLQLEGRLEQGKAVSWLGSGVSMTHYVYVEDARAPSMDDVD